VTGVQEESPLDCCTVKKGAALSYETSVLSIVVQILE